MQADILKNTLANFHKRISTTWSENSPLHLEKSRYWILAFLVFLTSSLVSYTFFRHREMHVSVRLAKVEFRDEIPRSFSTDAKLAPEKQSDITLAAGGKTIRFVAKPGDAVKTDQLLAVLDEEENRTALQNAIAAFKKAPQDPQMRELLKISKRQLEKSLVRSPANGTFQPKDTPVGAALQPGTVVGEIFDLSKLILLTKAPFSTNQDFPNHSKILISPAGAPASDKPIETEADIRAVTIKSGVEGTDVPVEFIVQPVEAIAKWVNQPVHLTIPLPSYKRVALVERSAVLTKDGDSKILLLNTYGLLHWQSVANAPTAEGRVVIRGADPKYFNVVVPENPELLSKAITLNVRPSVKNGR